MPELPEVESARQFVLDHCYGAQVAEVVVLEAGGGPRDGLFDEIVHESGPEELIAAVKDKNLVGSGRKGKQLWFQFSATPKGSKRIANSTSIAVLFHFGMTGAFVLRGKPYPQYQRFSVSPSWPPKFTKLQLIFSNGESLAFCDPRRLGRIKLREDPLHSMPVMKLAPDPINDDLTEQYLKSRLSNFSSAIKTVLLDQEKVCCGIGNWVADEVLHMARIHPNTRSNELSDDNIRSLQASINLVLKTAVSARGNADLFPRDWIFHNRWGRSRSKDQVEGIIDI